MFGYKLSTPTPILETMYMFDIILQYKELEKILKQENGEGDGENVQQNKIEEYQNDMKSQMNSYKSQMTSTLPSMPNFGNINSLTSGFKMPKY